MQRMRYYCLAGGATLFGGALLALQIVGGLEWTAGASLYTQASMVVTMVSIAALPVFISFAWRTSFMLGLPLLLGFILLLAYSLPATIGRIGEVKEVKVVAKGDAEEINRKIADLDKTLKYARPSMESECIGAPEPLPPRGWNECRRKRGSVAAFEAERRRLQADLDAIGGATARLGDTSSQMVSWALSLAQVSAPEEAIRKGSSLAFAVGLEVLIAALFALAAAALRKGSAASVRSALPIPAQEPPPPPLARQERPQAPQGPGGEKRAYSLDEARADLETLLKAGHTPESQDWLAERWGRRKSTVSRWFTRGKLEIAGRRVEGRRKVIIAA